MRVRLPLLVIASFVSAALVPVAASGATTKSRMKTAINAARAAHGLPPVKAYKPLWRSSSRYAKYMLANDVWAHASNPASGARVSSVGEILGMTTTPGPDVHGIVRAWLASPAHRPILLNRRYRFVGIGLGHGDMDGMTSWVWVVRFGYR